MLREEASPARRRRDALCWRDEFTDPGRPAPLVSGALGLGTDGSAAARADTILLRLQPGLTGTDVRSLLTAVMVYPPHRI